MSEDNDPQGNQAEIAERLDQRADEPAGEEAGEAPQAPAEDSQEVMPASDTQEQEQSEDDSELAEALQGSKNPERTKSYIQKLQDENKALKQEQPPQPVEDTPKGIFDEIRDGQSETPQVVEPVAPDASQYQNLTQNQTDNITQQFVTVDDNGEKTVDVEGLVNALTSENKRASTEALDKVEQYEQDRQSREANINHPQLDPKSAKFDRTFYDAVRDRALSNRHLGRQETLTESATAVQQYYKGSNIAMERKDAVADYKETQATRNQARPLLSGKSRDRQSSQATQDELRAATMSPKAHESDAAIGERLSRL